MSDRPSSPGRHERWIVPALIILFCVAATYISTTFKKMPPILKRGIQPSDFPQLLLSTIIAVTLLMVWYDPIRVRERVQGTVWGTLALFALFSGLTFVDFFLALAAFSAGLAFFWGERRKHVLAILGIVVPVAIFFLFDQVFEIRFPRGLITNLWYG